MIQAVALQYVAQFPATLHCILYNFSSVHAKFLRFRLKIVHLLTFKKYTACQTCSSIIEIMPFFVTVYSPRRRRGENSPIITQPEANNCFSINTQVIISKKRKKNISTRNHLHLQWQHDY